MRILAMAAAAATAAVAVPIVSMARRGTLDQQRIAAIRAGGRTSEAVSTVDDAAPAIPEPRRSSEPGATPTEPPRTAQA